jgi:hypothetical protein
MNRLAKSADGSDGLVGSRNGALFRRFNLAVALLHIVQPLPSSSVRPLSQVLRIGKRFLSDARLASLPEELRNSWVPSLPGN